MNATIRPSHATLERSTLFAGCFVAVALALFSCRRDRPGQASEPRSDDGAHVLELHLDEPPDEIGEESIFAPRRSRIRRVLEVIDRARTDHRVRGLFVRIGMFGDAFARAHEIGRALATVRAARKPVVCYLETTDNAGYVVAARGCDTIALDGGGSLDLVGVAATSIHVLPLMQSLGLQADVRHIGRYKSAPEMFTRDSISPDARESLEALLDDVQSGLVDAIATGRRMPREDVVRRIDAGPFAAGLARTNGFADIELSEADARNTAKTRASVTNVREAELGEEEEQLDLDDILGWFREREGRSGPNVPHIGLITVAGVIETGTESDPPASSRSFIRAVMRARENPNTRAVVVRIDSPGGSATASSAMWEALHSLAEKKPVVISIGDVCASGGYYIASAGRTVFADDTSIVGSIGVFGGKLVVAGFAGEHGIHADIITRSQNAAWTSPFRPFTPSEVSAIDAEMQTTYDRFIHHVATGRSLADADIRAVAEGRVWSGADGRTHRLIDRQGGLLDALAEARRLAGIASTAPVATLPRERTALERLIDTMLGRNADGDSARARAFAAFLPTDLVGARRVRGAIDIVLRLTHEHVLAANPGIWLLR